MMRAAAILIACAGAVWGQLALFTASPERPVGNLLQMGSAPMGDALPLRLRLRNTGQAPASVTAVTVAGTGFALEAAPSLPYVLSPGAALDFGVKFEPSAAGSYSASLMAGGISTILVATAVPAPTVSVQEGGAWRVLASGMQVDFGTVERGMPQTRRFQVANRTGEALSPVSVSVGGAGFGLGQDFPARVLAPGESATLELSCAPKAAGAMDGWLDVGQRRFPLRAIAVDPPLPRPEIVLTLAEARSARQGRLAVRLAEVSRTRATGEVKLEFEPAEPRLASDPGMTFASGLKTASFTVEEGDTAARFGAQSWVDFQTGSTAGNLVFTLEAAGFRERGAITIAPAPPGISSARAVRGQSSVEVAVTGLDNTRSLAQLSFTFYGKNGAALPGGPVRVDCEPLFRQFFESSGAGGVFALRAVFPVTGEAGQIEGVEAELAGPAGNSRTGRLGF